MTQLYPLILITLAVLFEVAADVLFKKWSIESRSIFFSVGLLTYFIGTVFWAISLKYEYLSKAVMVFTIINVILLITVAVVMFDEHLSTVNKIGIALGIVSIILLEM